MYFQKAKQHLLTAQAHVPTQQVKCSRTLGPRHPLPPLKVEVSAAPLGDVRCTVDSDSWWFCNLVPPRGSRGCNVCILVILFSVHACRRRRMRGHIRDIRQQWRSSWYGPSVPSLAIFHGEKYFHFLTYILLFRKTSPLTYLIYNNYGSKNV